MSRFPAAGLRTSLGRHAVGLATIALLLLLAWLIAHWAWIILAPPEADPSPPAVAAVDANQAADRIVAAHLFGEAGERQAPVTQVSTLDLRLKGVFAYSQDTPAYAIINSGGKQDEAFKVGDEIQPGVTLRAVHPTHILIERNGARERVNLEERPDAVVGAPRRAAPPSRLSAPQPQPTKPGNINLSRSEVQSSLQDPRQLANLGRVNTNPGGGVLVEEVPPGSLAERLGLQPGDVLRNVNGNPVNSPADLSRLYQQLNQAGQIRVEGSRGNRPLNLTYNVQQ